jgi:phage terminase large subunit
MNGIREMGTALHTGKLKLNPDCENTIFEIQSYVWDEKSGEDKPVKVNDHAMDNCRYFCKTLNITRKHAEYTAIWD